MPEGQSINDGTALLAAADEALSAGRWEEARAGFEATLEIEESGAALFGLALALWWLRDPVSSVRLQERAFGMLRRERDDENAFFTAMYLPWSAVAPRTGRGKVPVGDRDLRP